MCAVKRGLTVYISVVGDVFFCWFSSITLLIFFFSPCQYVYLVSILPTGMVKAYTRTFPTVTTLSASRITVSTVFPRVEVTHTFLH